MRPGEDELVRWREASIDPSALPARAADLVDAARDVPALPPETLARIRADVAGGARRPSRLRGLPLGLRLATLTALVLTSAATAKGAMLLWQRYVDVAAPEPEPAAPGRAAARARSASAPAVKPRVETAPLILAIDEGAAPAEEAAPEPETTQQAPTPSGTRRTDRGGRSRPSAARPPTPAIRRTRRSCWRTRSRASARRTIRAARSRCSTSTRRPTRAACWRWRRAAPASRRC